MQERVHNLNECQKKLTTSDLEADAVPGQLVAIKALEHKLHVQIHCLLTDIFNEIRANTEIGAVPGNGWVHKEGGTNRSGENHARGIIIASVTYNTPIPAHNHAFFLGIKPDNHGVTAAIESLVKWKILLVSQDVRNQDVYSLAPRIKMFLDHEILSIHPSYIKKLAEGNQCVKDRKAK